MAKTKTPPRRQQPDDSLGILDMLMICLRQWPWFLLSLAICLGTATYYLLSTPKIYTRKSSILVKSSGDKAVDLQAFEDLGVGTLTSYINDEIIAIHSPTAVYDMVKRLHLDISYYRSGIFLDEPLYAESLPVEVELHHMDDIASASFTMKLNGNNTVTLNDITLRGKEIKEDCTITIGERSESPLGDITVKPTLYYEEDARREILVKRTGYNSAASSYSGKISASLQRNTKNIIDITCNDTSIPRADNILRTLVSIYNENWVKSRNQISASTNEFIKERLAVIEEELGNVDQNIAGYKSSLAMPNVEAVANKALEQEGNADQERLTLSNQLYMVRYVRSYITDPSHDKQLLPASSGTGNSAVESQIATYNEKLLQRNNLIANSSEQNPLVKDLDIVLDNLKTAIVNSLDNAQTTLEAQLSVVQNTRNQAIRKLSANPTQANYLLSIERQQKVKESLYLFLLQKREENELSQAFTAYNTRVIAEPNGSSAPTSPVRNKILMIALGIALAVPAIFFILREFFNTTVRGRKDLNYLSVPFIGEIPQWKPQKGEIILGDSHFIVRQHSRDITNEAFRVVRTNLEFMLNNDEQRSHVIMLTSYNPNSGKTFISANLGASYGIRGSKVICIDFDFRIGSLSEYVGSPLKGITNYLSGHHDDLQSLIVHIEELSLDFLPMGKTPPNPTELLYSPKLKSLFDTLREQYDYIFIDCPPVEIVADSTIINREVDLTIFVIRAGVMERSMLNELEKNYEEKKYNKMAMLLNGTDPEQHYGFYRFGYGLGSDGGGYYGKSIK